jgi:hypothetical protein
MLCPQPWFQLIAFEVTTPEFFHKLNEKPYIFGQDHTFSGSFTNSLPWQYPCLERFSFLLQVTVQKCRFNFNNLALKIPY